MRSTPLTLASALLLGGALGCAETPAPVASVASAAPAPTVAMVAAPPVDLTPVAEPADIFVSARWKNPNATLSTLSSCAGVPAPLVETNARGLVDKALANTFRGGVDGRQIADLVAFDAPVDLLVALEPGRRLPPPVLFAFSIGLTSLDRARAALKSAGELVELAPGLYRVGAADTGDLTCALGPAAGAAPARLICGKHDKDILALGPYLARNVPVSEPPASDVHAELRFATVDQRYGADLRRGIGFLPTLARTYSIGEPRFDRALDDAASAIADEGAALVGDLDRATVDLGADASSCLEIRSALQLRGKSSWLAGTILEGTRHAGPAPAIFWRAPADSESASYGHGTDVSRYSGIFRALRALIEGKLAQQKIGSEADRRALSALIDLPIAKDTDVVVASGHEGGSASSWSLVGLEEGPAAISKLLKDAVDVYARKGLIEPARKELGSRAQMLPTARVAGATREFGKGGLDVQLTFDAPAAKDGKIVFHIMLMADAKTTWVAFGEARDVLVKHLLMVKSGAPEGQTLASRKELEQLHASKAVSSGFLTLSSLTRGVESALGAPGIKKGHAVEEMLGVLNNLPHKGATPIFITSDAASGAAPRGQVTLQMQKGSFEDLGVLLLAGLRIATTAGSPTSAHP